MMRLALLLALLLALATHAAAAQPVSTDTLEARLGRFAADLGAPRPDTRRGWDEAAVMRAHDRHIAPIRDLDGVSVEIETSARYDRRTGRLTLDALPTIATPPQVRVLLSWMDPVVDADDARPDARPDRSSDAPALRGTSLRPAVRLDAAEWRALVARGEARIRSTVRLGFDMVPPRRAGQPFVLLLDRLSWTPAGGESWTWTVGPPPPAAPSSPPRSDAPAPSPPLPPPGPKDTEVFSVVDQRPEIIGGLAALQAAVSYPDEARTAGIEGRVIAQFVVSETGVPTQIQVVRSVHPLLDSAAVAAIEATRFTPGRQRGRPVRVRMVIPVTFRLQ